MWTRLLRCSKTTCRPTLITAKPPCVTRQAMCCSCTGIEVLNRNYDVMPNGSELLGNTSSHYGSMIVQRPGDPDAYFVFHSSCPKMLRKADCTTP